MGTGNVVSRDEQKQDLRQKMLMIVSTDEQKQDLRQKMLKIVGSGQICASLQTKT